MDCVHLAKDNASLSQASSLLQPCYKVTATHMGYHSNYPAFLYSS